MTTQTQVIWDNTLDQNSIDQINAKGLELQAAGKEIGSGTVTAGPGADQKTAVRTWIDEPTALEWIAFVEQFNPVSAAIIT